MYNILVVNPGSTSTKIAVFKDNRPIFDETITYSKATLEKYDNILEQRNMREEDIKNALKGAIALKDLDAVVGRGGLLRPLESGTYRVTEKMVNDIINGRVQADHASNIGAVLAYDIAKEVNIPAFIADPVSVDEFDDIARISGIPDIERKSLLHALNVRAVALQAANDMGKNLNELNLIVAHLGGGITICPIRHGRIVDVNNAIEEGPFAPERAGGLPSFSLVKLCYSGKYTEKEMKRKLVGGGGLVAYLETNSVEEVEKRIDQGDRKAKLVFEAMAYQIAKEIGAMATVLKGAVDKIIITGGCAHSVRLINLIKERVSFIAPVFVYPGAFEMQALANAALRVLRGEEKEKTY
ncbi:MAG TPA: butyrate kinase [bacterium (Candidatus Stahlbacteria)]|nr:butyrate kinase [Candidatus Stahlbacteria bacterium]